MQGFKNGGRPKGLVFRAKLKCSAFDRGRTASGLVVFSHVFRKHSTARKMIKDVTICAWCYVTSLSLGIKKEELREKPSEGKDFANMHLNGLWQLIPARALALSQPPFLMQVGEIRWALDDGLKTDCSQCGVYSPSHRGMLLKTQLVFEPLVCEWNAVLRMDWVPVSCSSWELLNTAGRGAGAPALCREMKPMLCREQLHPLLVMPPHLRMVGKFSAVTTQVLCHITPMIWPTIKRTLFLPYACAAWGQLNNGQLKQTTDKTLGLLQIQTLKKLLKWRKCYQFGNEFC